MRISPERGFTGVKSKQTRLGGVEAGRGRVGDWSYLATPAPFCTLCASKLELYLFLFKGNFSSHALETHVTPGEDVRPCQGD